MAAEAPKKLKDLRVSDLKVELEKRGLATSGVKAVLAERLQKHLEEEGHDVDTFMFDDSQTSPKKPVSESEDAKDEPSKMDTPEDATKNEEPPKAEEAAKAETPKVEEAKEKPAIVSTKDSTQQPEEDSINLMLGEEEENLMFDEEKEKEDKAEKVEANGATSSPPRPENAPVVNPFTSRDTIDMSAKRANKNPMSDNSSMLVHPDESESVGTQESNDGATKDDQKDTSNGGGGCSGSQEAKISGDDAKKDEPAAQKDGEKAGVSLWVSGLSSSTRAHDLKTAFSKHGKVVAAKVVTNARTPGAKCYGYVTMSTCQDADNCIKGLDKTDLHGRNITVEKAKGDGSVPPKKESRKTPEKVTDGDKKDDAKKDNKDDQKDRQHDGRRRRDSHDRDRRDRDRRSDRQGRDTSDLRGRISGRRSRSPRGSRRPSSPRSRLELSPRREDRGRPGVLTFSQIRDEQRREKEREIDRRRRQRERERQAEEDRRRREEENKRRTEEERLHREREELRREREKLEREKQEILKFERERQRLERERLQHEKAELERLRRQQQSRTDTDSRRPPKRPMDDHRDPYYEDRKRQVPSVSNAGSGGSRYDRHDHRSSFVSGQKPDDRDRNNRGYSGGGRSGGGDYGGSGRGSDRDHRGSTSRSGGFSNWSGSGHMMGGGNDGGLASDWGGRGSSGPSAPRPPILSSSMSGGGPFGGSGMQGGPSGFGGSQQQSYNTDRFDAYKNPLMGQKRY